MATFTSILLAAHIAQATAAGDPASATSSPSASPPPMRIVCTTGVVGDMVRGIVGDRASVTTLMGPGVDPHLYKATASDVRSLASADAVVANGLMLEGRMQEIFPKLRDRGALVIEVGAGVTPAKLIVPDGMHGHPDPHIWMDPTLWAEAARHVARELAARATEHAQEFARRASEMEARWLAADARIASALASVPTERRVLVTAHDAFSYFGRRYSVAVAGIQGVSTESESGIEDIRKLVDLLVARKVPAVFVETTVADKSVRALIEGAAARGHAVSVGGSLYSDAMGEVGTFAGTYTGMIESNATTIVKALGGDARACEASRAEFEHAAQ